MTLAPQVPVRILVSFHSGTSPTVAPAELYFAVVTVFGVYWWNPATQAFGPEVARAYAGPLPAFGPATFFDLPTVSTLPAGPIGGS
jgi:hypothetical protein